jgi:hypothetical protein
MMKITHPIVIWWRGIYGLVFAIGMVWFILQMTLQPQTIRVGDGHRCPCVRNIGVILVAEKRRESTGQIACRSSNCTGP